VDHVPLLAAVSLQTPAGKEIAVTRKTEPLIEVPSDEAEQTNDVGAEGGGLGDVETIDIEDSSTGSEATETIRERPRQRVHVDRDRVGRRTP
jgi:hypothetical protein